jgi:hypothetical protein
MATVSIAKKVCFGYKNHTFERASRKLSVEIHFKERERENSCSSKKKIIKQNIFSKKEIR